MFQDRIDAGQQLAGKLDRYRDRANAVILALPRGGIVVGYALHQALHLPLDVFITRKLGAPGNPEYALGAITETGYRYYNPEALSLFGSGDGYLQREIAHQQREIEHRKYLYRGGSDLEGVGGRTVLVVDDGIATGSTVIAAVRGLRKLGAGRIVVAVPVAAPAAVRALQHEAHEVVVLSEPAYFIAVGAHYREFPQVDDAQVAAYLGMARQKTPV